MTLKEFHKLFFEKLSLKFEKNELDSFFFILIKHSCNLERIDFILNPEVDLLKDQENFLINSLLLLQKETPVQYIVGRTEFMNLNFLVNKNVLIPRPETEELVKWIIQDSEKGKNILDIGTGSGCIAISLDKYLPECQIFAWDVCAKALEIAEKNAKNNKLDGIVCSPLELKTVRKVIDRKMLVVVPGIRLEKTYKNNKDDQKRTLTPKEAIKLGADYLVIGRPIVESSNPLKTLKEINKSIEIR